MLQLPGDMLSRAEKIVSLYQSARKRIALAESCTGGLIATTLTSVPGASAVFERGFVSYSNDSKIDLLGVLPDLLAAHGAVSAEVAEAMAQGALDYSLADVAVAVTGIAGPDGGTPDKPIGTVFFGVARKGGGLFHEQCLFKGNRDAIRMDAAIEALNLLIGASDNNGQV